MPGLGAANVLWTSPAGWGLYSANSFTTGPDPGPYTFTFAVPAQVSASPAATLVVVNKNTDGYQTGISFQDSLGNNIPGFSFGFGPFTTHQGWFNLIGFEIGNLGGTLTIIDGEFTLDFISGAVYRTANGVLISSIVDIGVRASIYAGYPGGDNTPNTAVTGVSSSTDAAPTFTVVNPTPSGVVFAGEGAVGGASNNSSNPNWTDLVSDIQTLTRSGSGPGGLLFSFGPCTADLQILTDSNFPDLTPSWALGAIEFWSGSAGTLWVKGGGGAGNRVQVIG